MKINNKKETGVTLISLVVTIVIIIILAGITLKIGSKDTKFAEDNAALTEIAMVQNAILQRKTKVELTGENYPGVIISQSGIDINSVIKEMNSKKAKDENNIQLQDENLDNYYFLSTSNGGLEELGITNSDSDYIVNYKTGEVINYTNQVTKNGKLLYIG